MKPFPIVVGVVALCAAILVISWMSQPAAVAVPLIDETGQASANPFPIAETGPYPAAMLAEEMHDFGKMILGETGSHSFVIRNDGEAPLKLHKGAIACKCSVPTVPEGEIAPGESAEVVMEWKPLEATPSFDKWAIIWTNDPEHEKLTLGITGQVRQLVTVFPPLPWTLNNVNETGESEFSGAIVSGKDAFEIRDIESSDDWLSAEITPITPEELAEVGEGYSSGYVVTGKIRPEMTVGRFAGRVTFHTDLGDDHMVEAEVVGTRPGPFSILGQEWFGGEMTVRMGTFKADEGKSVSLALFTAREDEPITIQSVESTPAIGQVSITRDDAFPSPAKEKYTLTFTIPPGAPVGQYAGDRRVNLRITTSRAALAELNLSMDANIQ